MSIQCFGQTADRKNNISLGGGKQSYNGDLGNAWFKADEEWYGFVAANYSRYLNKSFDFNLSVTYGDYGHCREEGESEFRADGSEVLNMLSRLTTSIVSLRYKFSNGYILKENARLAPYIYAGAGFDKLRNTWSYPRANMGNYTSFNGGLGCRYNITKKYK